tara:strand:+ start:651 stop:1436 length:786 start_codon:yes stop_codon:yes gene_type:complete
MRPFGLRKIQSLFQDRLLIGSTDLPAHLTGGGPFLKVYENAYEARLLEVMGEDFPAVHTLLGDDEFAAAATDFVREHPSRERSIRWLGAQFPNWLGETPPWSDAPVLADMAAFEWALGLAFDAPDVDAVSFDRLAAVAPNAWPGLGFQFHPSLTVVDLRHDVAPFQQAVARDEEPSVAPRHFACARTVAVWRDPQSLIVRYRDLSPSEALALNLVRDGETFQALCEALAEDGLDDAAPQQAAVFLRDWVEAGWLVDLIVSN